MIDVYPDSTALSITNEVTVTGNALVTLVSTAVSVTNEVTVTGNAMVTLVSTGVSITNTPSIKVTDGIVAGQARIDGYTEDIICITQSHHEVHAGSHFYLEGYTTLGDGDSLYVKLETGNTTKWSHFVWSIGSSGITTTNLKEAPTSGMSGGSSITILNSNRNSDITSNNIVTSGVTAPTGGAIISQSSWGATGFKSSVGGGQDRGSEIILKQGTTYCRTFTSGAAENIISFRASWYESAEKN